MTSRPLVGCALVLAVLAAGPAAAQDTAAELSRLAAQLDHPLEHKRLEAIDRLGALGPAAAVAAPRLLAILERGDAPAQAVAARALPRIRPDRPAAAALERLLVDPERPGELRAAAATGLGVIAARVPPARTHVVGVLARELRARRHGNTVDVALARALGSLGPDAAAGLAALEESLAGSPFADVQTAAFRAIVRVSPPAAAQRSVAELVADLDAERPVDRARAYGSLRARAASAREAVAVVASRTSADRPVYERIAALEALAELDPASEAALAAFASASASDQPEVALAGRAGLEALGPRHAAEAAPRLLALLQRSPDPARQYLIDTLRRVNPDSPELVKAVLALLAASDGRTDELLLGSILDALRAAGPAARTAALEPLLRLLDPKAPIHAGRPQITVSALIAHALVALAELDPPASAAPRILAELERKDPWTLPAAIRAVGALGAEGAPAVPRLLEVLRDPPWAPMLPFLHEAWPTVEAIRALGRIGPAASAALPALRGVAQRDGSKLSELSALEVQAAREALRRIGG